MKIYNPPQLEVLEVLVEKGYSSSGSDGNDGGISAPGWG